MPPKRTLRLDPAQKVLWRHVQVFLSVVACDLVSTYALRLLEPRVAFKIQLILSIFLIFNVLVMNLSVSLELILLAWKKATDTLARFSLRRDSDHRHPLQQRLIPQSLGGIGNVSVAARSKEVQPETEQDNGRSAQERSSSGQRASDILSPAGKAMWTM